LHPTARIRSHNAHMFFFSPLFFFVNWGNLPKN
jgi:hypothetical protein